MQKDEIVKRLMELSDKNIGNINGYTEENVKIHVVIKLLEILGHSDHLDLEYSYGTNRPDIFIKEFEMPILIEVKGANIDIDSHIQQIYNYSYDMDSLLSVLTNGNLFYFFSPFWKRKSFEDRLILSFSLEDLRKEEIANKVISLLYRDRDIDFKQISKNVEILENGILAKEEEIDKKQKDISYLENKVKSIKEKYPNIEELKNNVEYLEQKIKSEIQEFLSINEQISELKEAIGRLRKQIPSFRLNKMRQKGEKIDFEPNVGSSITVDESYRRSPVSLSTLIKYGKLKEGDKLIFCNKKGREPYPNEYAIVEGAKLRYLDGNLYSANLAKKLRYKLGLTRKEEETQGPIFWITENGKLLDDLNNEVREEMKSREKPSN